MAEGASFMDKFAAVSTAIGNQIHLRSLRDSFSSIITLFILGGVAVLFNNVIFPAIMQGDMLTAWQTWGNAVLQGTQNFASVMLAGMIGFSYARNVRFDNAIGCVVVGIAAFIIVIPQSIEISGNIGALNLGDGTVNVSEYVTSSDGNYALTFTEDTLEENTDANVNTGDVEDVIPEGVTSLITENGTTIDFNQAAQETEEATAASLDGSGTFFAQALTSDQLGTSGLFVAIVMGLVATSIFIWLSGIEKLRINLGEGVPPAVSASFNVMIPMAITLMGCGLLAALLAGFFDTNVPAIINMVVTEPLRVFVGDNIWGAAFIFCMGMLLFTLGIHHSTINSTLLEPIMLVLMTENTEAFNQGLPVNMENYNYLNSDTQAVFGTMGGSGCTIGLIIATFLFSKSQSARAICALATAPGIFEINEPIIYGYPIVYNLPLMIAFVLSSFIGYVGSYFMTVLGLMNPCFVLVPWTTPPLINSFLATAGDWRAPICQLALIAVITVVYTFFMKIAESAGTGTLDEDTEEAA